MLLTIIEYPLFFNRPYRFLLAPFGVKKETMGFYSFRWCCEKKLWLFMVFFLL
jgi:hypothetical protein